MSPKKNVLTHIKYHTPENDQRVMLLQKMVMLYGHNIVTLIVLFTSNLWLAKSSKLINIETRWFR